MISLLLAQMQGHPLQVDMHMYFFAGLAVLGVYCDWRVLVMAAAATAIHHIGLNFLLPSALYPGGGNLVRLTLHAVIVVLETAVLVWRAGKTVQLFTDADAKAADAAAVHAAELRANAVGTRWCGEPVLARRHTSFMLYITFASRSSRERRRCCQLDQLPGNRNNN